MTNEHFGAETSIRANLQTAGALRSTLNPDALTYQGGGDIRFADASALQSAVYTTDGDGVSERQAGTVSLYVVREADSLGEIAAMFGVSINTIIWANDIENQTIHPGDTLVILPMSGVRHTVEEGDTLTSIAEKYNADVDEVAEFNGLDDEAELIVGDLIDIPDGEKSTPAGSTRLASASTSSYSGGWLIQPMYGVKTQGIHGYNGVDYGAPVGTRVTAAAGGNVVVAKQGGWNGGYGSYVIIKHPNGVQTLYAHLSTVIVGVGQYVVQGEVIGYSGNTGKSTGPHLHFEVRGATNPF